MINNKEKQEYTKEDINFFEIISSFKKKYNTKNSCRQ